MGNYKLHDDLPPPPPAICVYTYMDGQGGWWRGGKSDQQRRESVEEWRNCKQSFEDLSSMKELFNNRRRRGTQAQDMIHIPI